MGCIDQTIVSTFYLHFELCCLDGCLDQMMVMPQWRNSYIQNDAKMLSALVRNDAQYQKMSIAYLGRQWEFIISAVACTKSTHFSVA